MPKPKSAPKLHRDRLRKEAAALRRSAARARDPDTRSELEEMAARREVLEHAIAAAEDAAARAAGEKD